MRNICLIGGDRRNLELAKLLLKDKENIIKIFANEEINIKSIETCLSLEEAITENQIIVTGIPISKDGKYLTNMYSNKKIELTSFFQKLNNNILFSGMISEENCKTLNKNNNLIFDLLKDESYVIANAKFTVEGIIKYLIENTQKSLFNSKILVLGYGRIGKILCNVLKNFTENIYCMGNNETELELIKSNAINLVTCENFEEILKKSEIIVNTIPKEILTQQKLSNVNKEVFILDVASKPGGLDRDFAQKTNIKYLWKLGIPAEISPLACAEKIKDIMYKKILHLYYNNITFALNI